MAQPITWQNVNAPQIDAGRGMAVAGSFINHGFDKLGEVLKQQEAVGNANWDNTKLNNTNAYIEALASAKTPEELLAKQDLLAQLRQSAGAQMDIPAVLKATDLRTPELQQRAVAGIQYNNTMTDNKDAPILDQVAALNAQGKFDEAKALASQLIRGQGKAYEAIDNKQYQGTQRTRETTTFDNQQTEFGHKKEMWPLDVQAKNDAHLSSETQRDLVKAQTQAALSEPAKKAAALALKLNEVNLENLHKTGVFGRDNQFSSDKTVNAGNTADVIHKTLGKGNEKPAGELAKYYAENPSITLEKQGESPVDVPVPPAVVKRAIEMTNSGFKESTFGIGGSKGYGEDFKAGVKANVTKLMQENINESSKASVYKDYMLYNQLMANEQSGTVPVTSGSSGIPKPNDAVAAPTNTSTAKIDQAAAAVPAVAPVDPQKVLKEVTANSPKTSVYWVDGARYKYQSVTDSDNNVTGNAWVKDSNPDGMFSSGNAKSRVENKYSGIDGGSDTRSTPISTAAAKESLLKNSEGVTNAPAMQPKVSVPVATNMGQATANVSKSETVNHAPDGSQTLAAPLTFTKAEIKALGKPQEIVTAYKGAIPAGQGTKVIATVSDGDTINFNPANSGEKVPGSVGNVCRFDVIDAPETAHTSFGKKGQPSGEEAAKYLRQMIDNKEVTIRVTGQAKRTDTNKTRNLCQVEFEGKGVDLEMVKAGFAMVYNRFISPNNPRFGALKSAEEVARTQHIGQFKGGGYVQPPWDFRNELNPNKR